MQWNLEVVPGDSLLQTAIMMLDLSMFVPKRNKLLDSSD